REWAPNANDARHILVLSGGVSSGRTGTVTFFGRLQSGLPFTPIVQGDVNGDGRTGDRAHIPSFSAATGELYAALRALRADGADAAAGCLTRFEGRVATRNGCRGPWTHTLNMQWRPPIPRKWMGRVTANVYVQNILGGVDQLVNGSDLRGWGSPAQPDPVLLVPRGFDAGTGTFRYDVNPRFAETRPTRTSFRAPFQLSIDFSVDLSTNYDLQQLRRALEPVRGPDRRWTRRGADSITAFYLARTSSIHGALLEESDSLFLSKEQIARLQVADSIYSAQVRGIYLPLGEYLASTGGAPPGQAQLDSVGAVQKAYWKIFWQQPEVADSILTPLQKSLMPPLVQMLRVPAADREKSKWYIGTPVTLRHAPRGRART
ncbi:MAG TPA: hypothetical protein VFO66_10215, partial [Gemmatimonadaceae bacterium]|nr:hypothetical protein [Gemmatimonadaceae bacterium]